MNKTTLTVTAAIAGGIAGALGVAIILHDLKPAIATNFDTFRPTIKAMAKQVLDDCKAFDPNNHPSRLYQVRLPGVPLDIRNLKPVITEFDLQAQPPWTTPVTGPGSPYNGAAPSWTPTTPLDMDLNLSPGSTGPARNDQVLIQIVVDDPSVKFIEAPYTIISTDSNGKMFCKYMGGFPSLPTDRSVTFSATYVKPVPNNKTYGSYSVGLYIPATDGTYVLPIYIDPEVENNGIN